MPPEVTAKRVASLMANGTRAKKSRIIDGVESWLCPACENWLPRASFYEDGRTPSGIKAQCKGCHLATSTATRNPENVRRLGREHMRRARIADPAKFRERERVASAKRPKDERVLARRAVHAALRSGRLTRPGCCSRCSRTIKVTAHHPDYTKPLDVVWLCYECHANE